MNEHQVWSDWRFWINRFLFGTFGYGGGMMGWYLCLFMRLLLHVPLAMATVMVLEGVMVGLWSAPLHGEVFHGLTNQSHPHRHRCPHGFALHFIRPAITFVEAQKECMT